MGELAVNPDTVNDLVAAIREKTEGTTDIRLGTLVGAETIFTDIHLHPHGSTHIMGEAYGLKRDVMGDESKYYAFHAPQDADQPWTVEGYNIVDMVSGRMLEFEQLPDTPLPDDLPIHLELPPGFSYKPDLDIDAVFYGTWDALRRNIQAARQLGLLIVYQSEATDLLGLIRNGQPVT